MIVRKKQKIIKKISEYSLQSEAFKKYGLIKPNLKGRVISINNNSANVIKGARNKKLGVIAGISDMIFILDDQQIVWIEWKTSSGRQSIHQAVFETMMKSIGHKYHIVRNFEEFISVLSRYENQCTKKLFNLNSVIKNKFKEKNANHSNK